MPQSDVGRDVLAIEEALAVVKPQGTLVTGWYVIVEYMDTEGELQLIRIADPTIPEWRVGGLLDYAANHEEDDEEGDL